MNDKIFKNSDPEKIDIFIKNSKYFADNLLPKSLIKDLTENTEESNSDSDVESKNSDHELLESFCDFNIEKNINKDKPYQNLYQYQLMEKNTMKTRAFTNCPSKMDTIKLENLDHEDSIDGFFNSFENSSQNFSHNNNDNFTQKNFNEKFTEKNTLERKKCFSSNTAYNLENNNYLNKLNFEMNFNTNQNQANEKGKSQFLENNLNPNPNCIKRAKNIETILNQNNYNQNNFNANSYNNNYLYNNNSNNQLLINQNSLNQNNQLYNNMNNNYNDIYQNENLNSEEYFRNYYQYNNNNINSNNNFFNQNLRNDQNYYMDVNNNNYINKSFLNCVSGSGSLSKGGSSVGSRGGSRTESKGGSGNLNFNIKMDPFNQSQISNIN
jgi:hypothetical protein